MENIEKILEKLEKNQEKSAVFFNNILKNTDIVSYSLLLNDLLSNASDTICAKNIIIEINKRMFKENLLALKNFVMYKKQEDFSSGFDICDFEMLRVMCVKTLGKYGDKTVVAPLLSCLNNEKENYKFRLAIAETLGKIGDTNAVESLINLVKNDGEKSIYVRESAALALGMIGDLRAIDPFINFLTNSNSLKSKFTFLKERVIEALGNFAYQNDNRIMNAIETALFDNSIGVRLNALETISNTNCVEMADKVKELLKDDDEEVQKGAIITLYNLKGAEILEEILKDENISDFCKDEARKILDEYE